MNLHELNYLMNEDEIVFKKALPFTEGKRYIVKNTLTGRVIYDDNGLGHYLCGLHEHFNTTKNEKGEES